MIHVSLVKRDFVGCDLFAPFVFFVNPLLFIANSWIGHKMVNLDFVVNDDLESSITIDYKLIRTAERSLQVT
jgi:hypothetical protein